MRSGTADLPLHGGRVPMWLASRMAKLGRVIVEALVIEYGREEVLRRLADPFWFQALGCVMGMDWHSSGITTSVLGALKRGLAPVEYELGIHVCGGRGRHSRRTPDELTKLGERLSIDAPGLVRTSRLVAKVDSAAVQDGFDLYLHGFIVTDDGKWVVVQQGMNPERRQARRYHWLWDRAGSFVDQPHAAIEGEPQALPIVNFTDHGAVAAREQTVALVGSDPARVVADVERVLVMPFYGIDHAGRAFLALSQYVRYGGEAGDTADIVAKLIGKEQIAAATTLGLAQSTGYLLTGGALGLLKDSTLSVTPKTVKLSLRAKSHMLNAEVVGKALQQLAKAMGRTAEIETA